VQGEEHSKPQYVVVVQLDEQKLQFDECIIVDAMFIIIDTYNNGLT
jgi:hypothetical protein